LFGGDFVQLLFPLTVSTAATFRNLRWPYAL